MNTFMNLVKRSSEVGATRGRVEASGGVKASSLPALDLLAGTWAPASLSSSLAGLTGVLRQGLRQVVRDFGAIAKDGSLIVMLLFRMGWLTRWVWNF